MGTIIKTDRLCRDFQVGRETIHAVKEMCLDINEGSFTILRGRSGSGKTTLINLLGLIDKPSRGSITVLNKQTDSMTEEDRNNIRQNIYGFVFQSGALIPNMTVYENVELVLRLSKFPPKERRSRVEQCIELVGLSKKLKQYPQELSGGEMQRIGIARAIAHKPKIIFADEPTSALDFNTGLRIVKLFKSLIEKEGLTLVMTTHDPKLIPAADYVYSIKDGEIVNE